MTWDWTTSFINPEAPGIPEAQQRQSAAEGLLRKLGEKDELGITIGSMVLWAPFYDDNDCGELRRFDANGIQNYIQQFNQLPQETLTDHEQAFIRDLEAVLERYPDG